jgi:hypothetical protein
MPHSPADDAAWEQVWRESTDDFLIESARNHLWQCLHSPQPGFGRLAQICREAHRRGKPELLLRAVESLVPIRTASGEDVRALLRAIAELRSALILADREIVKLNSEERNAALLQMMRNRLEEAKQVAERFAAKGDE